MGEQDPGGPAPAGLRQGSWLAGAGFPDPAVLAGLAAVAVAAAPWLSRPWRRAAWATLLLIGAARLITGGLLPMQLVLALAAGVTVGAGLLVAFGVPDRRMGPAGVAAALGAGGVPVSQVTGPLRAAKGSRPFEATTGDGNGLFVKVFGSDQRDADLLYRAWRGIRLRGVGDTRPAGPLRPAIGRRPGPGGAAAGVRRPARMPGARLLPARAEAGLRAPVPGLHPARRRRSADAAGPAGRGHRRRAAVRPRWPELSFLEVSLLRAACSPAINHD
jgi:hypothetical protein